jgi:uncharacterized membrane protein
MNIKTVGIILIIVGAIMVLYTGFNYVTSETIVDIGPLEINADKNNFVSWSPYLGAVLLIVGLVIIFFKK